MYMYPLSDVPTNVGYRLIYKTYYVYFLMEKTGLRLMDESSVVYINRWCGHSNQTASAIAARTLYHWGQGRSLYTTEYRLTRYFLHKRVFFQTTNFLSFSLNAAKCLIYINKYTSRCGTSLCVHTYIYIIIRTRSRWILCNIYMYYAWTKI